MSWSRSFASLEDFMQDKGTPDLPPNYDVGQYVAARQAAEGIIQSGCVGGNRQLSGEPNVKDFFVYLSGHANANHEPTVGWANDCITVTVTQK